MSSNKYALPKRFLELYLVLLNKKYISCSDFFEGKSLRSRQRYTKEVFRDLLDPGGNAVFDSDGEHVWISKKHKEWLTQQEVLKVEQNRPISNDSE